MHITIQIYSYNRNIRLTSTITTYLYIPHLLILNIYFLCNANTMNCAALCATSNIFSYTKKNFPKNTFSKRNTPSTYNFPHIYDIIMGGNGWLYSWVPDSLRRRCSTCVHYFSIHINVYLYETYNMETLYILRVHESLFFLHFLWI